MLDSTKLQLEKIRRGTVEVISEAELASKIEKKKSLKIKAGFDPTAPDLHLGHLVLLRKLRHFQELGHTVYFLLGDFTGMIGDPSGKSETRKRLTKEEVAGYAKTYQEQVFKILDPKATQVVFNSEWCLPMKVEDVLGLTAKYSVARLLERDDFSKRYKSGNSISLLEFMYPLFQGYDSVVMESDVEIGGTDQKFNLLVGRELQRDYGKEAQCVVTLPLLVGLDGEKKMSKSLGNYVGITEAPIDMYGKLMSVSDTLMWSYFEILTDIPLPEIESYKKSVANQEIHPKEMKTKMARAIMDQLHPASSNEEAIEEWNRIHNTKARALPDEIPTHSIGSEFFQDKPPLLASVLNQIGFTSSASEGRRLIKNGGIYVNEEKIQDESYSLSQGNEYIIRQGKKGKFIKIVT
ncbi:tyrosine--tRNA ligase [Leptospira sp. GIMC2001]|uniref:tyrosine--tRNA ligase n=1 Tax=Leptospira sp. GIMC2001 TaxID=1513297 RepID=UPI00234AF82F|nr:tyrosine--tRNA ligase [Leptospira sp. GIMC2001]WCL48143.1 tyrosine--tRNA ligase [Leptospira sp. GIMC2001]